jgi:hypothetical protein
MASGGTKYCQRSAPARAARLVRSKPLLGSAIAPAVVRDLPVGQGGASRPFLIPGRDPGVSLRLLYLIFRQVLGLVLLLGRTSSAKISPVNGSDTSSVG